MGQCMFREKNIDNPPSYDEITASKINKAVDMDTINRNRTPFLKKMDDKYNDYLNKNINSLNKRILKTSNHDNSIEYKCSFTKFKKTLGIKTKYLFEEYYAKFIKDMIKVYEQYDPKVIEYDRYIINWITGYYNKKTRGRKIILTLWSTNGSQNGAILA